jgi:hypothetical protein
MGMHEDGLERAGNPLNNPIIPSIARPDSWDRA